MNDLLLKTLRGEPTTRRPLWIMRQAGRYLPEYRALRERYGFEELVGNPELASRVTLLPLDRFPLDAAIVFADLMSPVASLGVRFRFEPGPVLERPVRSAADVRALRDPAPEEIAPEVMETLRTVKPALDGRAALLGFAGAPWTLAAYLVQGRGAPGFPALRALAAADAGLLGELLGRLARLLAGYVRLQARAGADAVQIFDTWAGVLSLDQWSRLVRPHLLALLEEMGRAGIPRILFVQDAPHLVGAFAELPAEALAVDWREDLPALHARLGARRALQGNLDPAALVAGPAVTRAAARDLLTRMPAGRHIVNLGHGILPDTPVASVEALVASVREEEER